MKKKKQLAIKKVTLRNLDESTLDAIAGGATTSTCSGMNTCSPMSTCPITQCSTCPNTCVLCPTRHFCPP